MLFLHPSQWGADQNNLHVGSVADSLPLGVRVWLCETKSSLGGEGGGGEEEEEGRKEGQIMD